LIIVVEGMTLGI